jgi:hypothetical protein
MPPDDKGALLWLVQAVTGFIDERSPQFERDRQRLVVFREKRKAAERAKAKSNESWSGKVRPVKIV